MQYQVIRKGDIYMIRRREKKFLKKTYWEYYDSGLSSNLGDYWWLLGQGHDKHITKYTSRDEAITVCKKLELPWEEVVYPIYDYGW